MIDDIWAHRAGSACQAQSGMLFTGFCRMDAAVPVKDMAGWADRHPRRIKRSPASSLLPDLVQTNTDTTGTKKPRQGAVFFITQIILK